MNTTVSNNLPSLSNEGGLSAYLDQIKKFPMLAAEEEYMPVSYTHLTLPTTPYV